MIEMNGMRYSKFPRRSDVGPIELKYYVEDVDRHGNIRRYFRRKGQRKIRLPGLPGSVEFMDAYRSALAKSSRRSSTNCWSPGDWFIRACLSFVLCKSYLQRVGPKHTVMAASGT